MTNLKHLSGRNVCKYTLVFPLLLTICFVAALPAGGSLQAAAPGLRFQAGKGKLKAFEGKYKPHTGAERYFQITGKDTNLVLKQLWDNRQVVFVQMKPLEFLSTDKHFPLKFTKDQKGNVTQVLAFGRDVWDKVAVSKLPAKTN